MKSTPIFPAEETESRFARLVAEAPVGIVIVTGKDFVVDVVNDFYCHIANRTKEELLHKPVFSIIPEAKSYEPFLTEVMETGKPIELHESPYVTIANGRKQQGFINVVHQPLKDAYGKTESIIITVYDVTAQVMALRQSELSEARSKLAIDLAELGMYDVDLKTNTLVTNQRYKDIMGFAYEATRNEYRQALHPDDKELVEKAHTQAFLNGALDYEARIMKPDKSVGWIRARGKIFFDDNGEAEKLVGVLQDITTQKVFAEELELMVAQRMKELVEVNMQLKQSNTELNQFAYITSHDMQEPLRKIKTFAQLLESSLGNMSDKQRMYMEKIQSSAGRMQMLIRDVLQLSELSGEEAQEKFVAVDLNKVLKNVLSDYELLIEQKKARINVENLPNIKAIPVQMSLLFSNLISNSLKFGNNESGITIHITCRLLENNVIKEYTELSPDTEYYLLKFQDNGIGFNQQNADKIFNIFQRLHTKAEYEGTGIGLALCKKIIHNHHGLISATSIAGQGALFTIILPKEIKSTKKGVVSV